jgi:DNA polymerase-3 subunit alpha
MRDIDKGNISLNTNNEYYYKAVDEIKENYDELEWQHGLESCKEINDKVESFNIMDKPHLPKFSDTPRDDIIEIIKKNMKKIPFGMKEAYFNRIMKELKVYEKTNSLNYLLIVRDFLKYADKEGYLRNFGRGSACSSLVTYLMDIHYVDPVKIDLYFERFLNENRGIKMRVFEKK